MKPESKFCTGQRFLKWKGKNADPNSYPGPGHSCVLRVDPGGHIFYWTREHNWSKTKEVEYRFIANVVDVRKGKYAVLEHPMAKFDDANILQECLMTIVLNTDFVNPEFLTFMITPEQAKEVDEWADYIFKLSQETRRNQRGVLFYLQKLFAPLRYANNEQIITIDDVIKVIVPLSGSNNDTTRLQRTLSASGIFNEKEKIRNVWGIARSEFDDEKIFEIYNAITDRQDIRRIFARRTRDRRTRNLLGRMDLKRMQRFLNHVQRDPRQNELIFPEYSPEAVKRILFKYSRSWKFMSEEGFTKYLLSDDNVEITNYSLRFAEENMHEPLSSYFISTSHNSYLIGAQISQVRLLCANHSSSADVEIYRQLLLSGCRCVELDCWDGSNGEPIITHGPSEITLIDPVLFKDVCNAIAESAFKTSDYPVCLSIENHCSSAQQARMAEIFIESFGDLLLKDPLPDIPLLPDVPLPSPYKLRRKILIKGRKKASLSADNSRLSMQSSRSSASIDSPSQEHDSMSSDKCRRSSKDLQTSEILERNSKALYEMAIIADNEDTTETEEVESSFTGVALDEEKFSTSSFSESQRPTLKSLKSQDDARCCTELSHLVNYLQSHSSSTLKLKGEDDKRYYQMHSLTEKKAIDIVAKYSSLLAKHNVRHLIRVYPDGSRFKSTNYMPTFGWMVGIQMMALNFQTNGIEMQMNQTMFEENGLCGYVLKPSILRDSGASSINIFGESIHSTVLANRIEIKVLSGQLLTTLGSPRTSTYVQVDFYGLPLEQLKGRFKTKIVQNNAINPVYSTLKDEPFVIEKIRFPERSVVYIRLMSDRGEQLAHRVLPVHLITNGYRHVILRNAANRPAGAASLFLHIKVDFYVPAAHKVLQEAFAEPLKVAIKQEEMKSHFADPLNCRMEEEEIETDEVESDEELDSNAIVVDSARKRIAFSKRIRNVFARSNSKTD